MINDYFQSYTNYFWQWEEAATVLAIPGESTIAYKELVMEALKHLAPQGVPPFGALLMAIIATNPKGSISIDAIVSTTAANEVLVPHSGTKEDLQNAIDFLQLLATVPEEYKKGRKRLLLFQAIFENCHYILSIRNSGSIVTKYTSGRFSMHKSAEKKELDITTFYKDFRAVALLKKRFGNVKNIISAIAGLPEMKDELLLLNENDIPENEPKDLVEQLIDESKSFHVGALVKRIWSGLNIPVHNSVPSQQPLGGVSDLTNKGDFDKLLISEFANDDLVFLSRLANNEALYIQREIPPANNDLQRIILIDISLKNWGTPRIIAFATMLAIAKHPKTSIACSVFAVGKSYHPVSIESVDTIIDGLQLLEGSLNAASGFDAFFREYGVNKNMEIFVITEPSTLKQVGMLKAMNEHNSFINYWIHTDAEGNIDVYKKQQNSKRHLQHLLLPLHELWNPKTKKNLAAPPEHPVNTEAADYPILFRNSVNSRRMLSTENGEIFQVTGDKTLLRSFDKTTAFAKGWEMMYDKISFPSGEYEIGRMHNGDHVLLMFNPQNREVVLLNVETGEKITLFFQQWKSTGLVSFVFSGQKFQHQNNVGCWGIDEKGKITEEVRNVNLFTERHKALNDLATRYAYSPGVFKNITSISINDAGRLVFNIHELLVNNGGHIKLNTTRSTIRTKNIKATKKNENEFIFDDGSTIRINRSGMFILRSSNPSIPVMYLPSALDSALAIATDSFFAGNEYYYKEPLYQVTLSSAGANKLNVVKIIKSHIDLGLADARDLVDHTPSVLLSYAVKDKANKLSKALEAGDATVEVKEISKHREITKMSPVTFFANYLDPFIQHIQLYGTNH